MLIFTKLSQNIIDIFQHLTWCSCSSNKFSRSGHAETAFTSHANYKGTSLRLHIVVILILKCWQQVTSIASRKIVFGSIQYFWKKTRPFKSVSCRNSSTVVVFAFSLNGMEWNSLEFFFFFNMTKESVSLFNFLSFWFGERRSTFVSKTMLGTSTKTKQINKDQKQKRIPEGVWQLTS